MSEAASKQTVMPMLTVASVDKARAFYVDKLGFSHNMGMLGKDGNMDFCNVILGSAMVMLTRGQGDVEPVEETTAKRPVAIYIEVPDVDAYHAQVASSGVKLTSPLTDQWWGDRTFTVIDPFGYELWFYKNVAAPVPPKGAKLV